MSNWPEHYKPELRQMIHTARIVMTDGGSTDSPMWEYHTWEEALKAITHWAAFGGPEPEGWHRSTNGAVFRRRPDGDPAREYVEP